MLSTGSQIELKLRKDQLLKDLSTFGIGGPADLYIDIRSIEEMQQILIYCKEKKLPFFILGKGSNCLFDDKGFNGLIIHNKIHFKNEISSGTFHVGAGFSFSLLGTQTAHAGFSGLEFASGIPGSVGGAVFMNAGANGKETCESLISVDYITENGDLKTFFKEDLHFSYRTSSFQQWKTGVIVAATFQLTHSIDARQKQIEIFTYRKNTQPYKEKSAGCVFRNQECSSAGLLIDQCGLKGTQLGGAEISSVHANFIINSKEAKAKDVLELIHFIKNKVKEQTGNELESEIRYIPYQELNRVHDE